MPCTPTTINQSMSIFKSVALLFVRLFAYWWWLYSKTLMNGIKGSYLKVLTLIAQFIMIFSENFGGNETFNIPYPTYIWWKKLCEAFSCVQYIVGLRSKKILTSSQKWKSKNECACHHESKICYWTWHFNCVKSGSLFKMHGNHTKRPCEWNNDPL